MYAKTEELPQANEYYRGATLVQKNLPRNGTWTTDFFAQIGRKVTPLFTLFFLEGPHSTTIDKINFSMTPVFTECDCKAIRASAKLV